MQTCLVSAARSHDRAAATADPERRRFFEKMEASWIRLAASIAHVERIDLFLPQPALRSAMAAHCWRCEGTMRLKLVDVTRDGERHTFECLRCGFEQVHSTAH